MLIELPPNLQCLLVPLVIIATCKDNELLEIPENRIKIRNAVAKDICDKFASIDEEGANGSVTVELRAPAGNEMPTQICWQTFRQLAVSRAA